MASYERELKLILAQIPRKMVPVPPLCDPHRLLSSIDPMLVSRLRMRCRRAIEAEERGEFRILFPQDDDFPATLRDARPAPRCLFWRGRLWPTLGSAVVGSRETCASALRSAHRAARQLALGGETVVSGLARGCDTAAHQGCLSADGRTIAVLPSGFDQLYPPENRSLLQRIIAQGGAYCSEYLPDTPVQAWQCVQRDRLQSALSRRVLIVASGERGGAMYCARWGRRQGRRVYVWPPDKLPGATAEQISGNLALLRGGCADRWPSAGDLPADQLIQPNTLFEVSK